MTNTPDTAKQTDVKSKPPSLSKLLIDLGVSIAIPVYILRSYSSDDKLGPSLALLLALAFPLLSGAYDLIKERKLSLAPTIGFVSILLTGGIGILRLPKEYIAIKEALVPLGFGLAVLASTFTKKPLVRTFIYNDMFLETQKVAKRIADRGKQLEFDRVMVKATWILAGSFLISSVLNYVLAKWIIVSETGTEAFNKEFGTMTALSYPVIVVPSMIVTIYSLYFVINRIMRLTEFELDDILRQE